MYIHHLKIDVANSILTLLFHVHRNKLTPIRNFKELHYTKGWPLKLFSSVACQFFPFLYAFVSHRSVSDFSACLSCRPCPPWSYSSMRILFFRFRTNNKHAKVYLSTLQFLNQWYRKKNEKKGSSYNYLQEFPNKGFPSSTNLVAESPKEQLHKLNASETTKKLWICDPYLKGRA